MAGANRTRTKRAIRRCVVETLEQRRLLSFEPVAFEGFVGPLREFGNPMTNTAGSGYGPSSELHAAMLSAPSGVSYSFYVTYRDDQAVRASSIDSHDVYVYGPNGYARRAVLVSIDDAQDGPVRVARYKVAPPDGSWDARDNGLYTVTLQSNQVFDIFGVAAGHGIISQFQVQIASVSGPPTPGVPPSLGIDVRNFGARPDDGVDDTDAIQAAIDSLPKSDGAPRGTSPAGGVILFPAGIFDITRPLRLHSGVALRGAGYETIIHSIFTDRSLPAIQLHSPFSHHWNVGASIESLTIYTRWSLGVAVDPAMNGDVTDLMIRNVRISALGPALDLRNAAVYHAEIDDVEIYNPGSTALHLGRAADNISNANRIRNLRVTGTARSGFKKETALVYVGGDVLIQGMTLAVSGARLLPLYVTGRTTFNGLDIQVPAADCPGGYAVHFDRLGYAQMDSVRGVGIGRKLLLTDARDVQVRHMLSDGTSNVISHITSMDARSYLRVGNALGGRLRLTSPAMPAAHARVPAPTTVVDAKAFGVVPNDGFDDTAGIQAAINSLALGNGLPGPGQVIGGIVQLPMGILNTHAPIKIPSGVWLRGHAAGTVIRNLGASTGAAAIELTSPFTHRSNVGAAVIDLGIYTRYATGIRTDSSVSGEVRDLSLVGLRLTTGGPSIDLRNAQVNYAQIERVVVTDPGSTVIWLGREDNSSSGNLVRGLRVIGDARNGFLAERALFVYQGGVTVESGAVEDTFANLLPIYASGAPRFYDVFLEYPAQPDGVGVHFDRVSSGFVDNFFHIDKGRRLHVTNSSNVEFGNLNIDGYGDTLRDCVHVDGSSRLVLNAVNSQWDSGMLDHPRVIVKGFYSTRSERFIETWRATSGNFIVDPTMTSVSDDPEGDGGAGWHILWGDALGAIDGTYTVETVGGEKRLKITILENPNQRGVSIRIKMNVPAAAVGREGIARWRIDATGDVLVWTRDYSGQYQARSLKSMTASFTPVPMRQNEAIWIDLPQAAGTYYIWKVGMVAA